MWFNDKPHGDGIFFFFQKGIAQEGVWFEGNCKSSAMRIIEYRQTAKEPTSYPIPMVCYT